MTTEKVDVLVVGGGQAGVAASEHLSKAGINHLIIEKSRIAESWRTARWDSLKANGPAWHDRFPGLQFRDYSGDDFVSKENVADYLEDYARNINAPTRTGVEAIGLKAKSRAPGFVVETSAGYSIEANSIIVATGAFQVPLIPKLIAKDDAPGLHQMHSAAYKNPQSLPDGNVLVVGSGSSGAQIAEELANCPDRKVYLSIGPHDRPPRRYRGRDFVWWLGVLNLWDAEATPGVEHTTIAVSGANGGHTIDFREMAAKGVTLLGRSESFKDGSLVFADNLKANIQRGDDNYLDMLDQADAYIEKNGLDLPEEPSARDFLPDPKCMTDPILSLDLKKANISTIIWATGFKNDYTWLEGTKAIDQTGAPLHQRGVSNETGIYYLGLPWQTRRGSSFIWGVWHDAATVVGHIHKKNNYLNYEPSKPKYANGSV